MPRPPTTFATSTATRSTSKSEATIHIPGSMGDKGPKPSHFATQTLVDTKAPSSAFVPHLHQYHAPRLRYRSKSIGFYHHSCTALYSLCRREGLDFDNENGKVHRPSRFAAKTFIDTKAPAEFITTRSTLNPEAPVYTPRSVGDKKLESYLSRLILTALLRQKAKVFHIGASATYVDSSFALTES